jgi:hypothetical protein
LSAHTAHAAQRTLAAVADRFAEDAEIRVDSLDDFLDWWVRANQ